MSISRFKEFLKENGIQVDIKEFTDETHTAEQAAKMHNVLVSNIVKSLLVKIDKKFVLYLVPGDQRLDIDYVKLQNHTHEVRMATAEEVKSITGYSIGGVPPFGHMNSIEVRVQDGFNEDGVVVAAAGSRNSTFEVEMKRLKSILNNLGLMSVK
ncbi:YbaK/EbsC family protein [bacterium]|nr:YbaK/EbsC family protein [bacterium]